MPFFEVAGYVAGGDDIGVRRGGVCEEIVGHFVGSVLFSST